MKTWGFMEYLAAGTAVFLFVLIVCVGIFIDKPVPGSDEYLTDHGRRDLPKFQAQDRVELVGTGRKTVILHLEQPGLGRRTYRYWLRMPEITKGFLEPGVSGELRVEEWEIRRVRDE